MGCRSNSDIFNLLQLEISHSGHVFLDQTWQCINARSPFSRLYYVKSGRGFLQSYSETTKMQGGYVYLIPADCEFTSGCQELEKIFFHISVRTPEQYDLLSSVSRVCSLPFSEAEYHDLLNCFSSNNYLDLLKLKTIIHQTIITFAETYHFNALPVKQYSDMVQKALCLIQQNPCINLNAAQIASQLFVSESKLRRTFQEETGITVGKYIDDLVYLKATQMLGQRNLSIGEISQNLGFCDQFYFSRRFKEKYGLAPLAFRKSLMVP